MNVRRWIRLARRQARDAARIVAGRRADGTPRSIATIRGDLGAYRALRRSWAAGDGPAALREAERLYPVYPEIPIVMKVVSEVGTRRGGMTMPLAATSGLVAAGGPAGRSPTIRRRERDLRARLEETEPGWLPLVPGPVRPVTPRASNVVMHLLKASLPDRQSGYTIRSREVLHAQATVGLEPFAVTPYGYPPTRPDGPAPAVELVDGIPHHRLDPGIDPAGFASTDVLARTAAMAATLAERERPAIIHAASGHRGYETALVGLAVARHLRLPVVYEVRGFLETAWTSDPDVAESAEWTKRRYAKELEVMAAVDGITTLSGAMRAELEARGVPSGKIVVVPNGIDPASFAPEAADPGLVDRYGLADRWVFGYVSSMDHVREGHALLIEATARLVGIGRRVMCLLVGDGRLRARLEAHAASVGASEHVVFAGRVPFEEIRAHYALFDAFVVPRLPDRAARFVTPLKPYEAMAMERPLIVSDLPALVEIAAPDERGLAFRTSDVESLVTVLERMIDHPELAGRLGAAGRAWVLSERTWATDGARYADLYRSILERADPVVAGQGGSPATG